MSNKGKLILSTKSSFAVRKAVIGVCGLIFIIMAIIMMVNYKGIKSAFGGGSTGEIITIVAILFFILYPLIMFVMLCHQRGGRKNDSCYIFSVYKLQGYGKCQPCRCTEGNTPENRKIKDRHNNIE